MASATVHCSDSRVSESIERWLHGLRLNGASDLSLEVRIESPPPHQDARVPFKQPGVLIRSGPPGDRLSIEWTPAPARATIGNGTARADLSISREAWDTGEILFDSFLQAVLIFLLRRRGLHHLHAANARDPQGRDWLFVGNARDGKSTTAALLASRGWEVAGDDQTFLSLENGTTITAVSPRRPLTLRDGGLKLLEVHGGVRIRPNKRGFHPEELGGRWIPRTVPDLLVFPTVQAHPSRARSLKPVEALRRLVRWSAWVMLEERFATEHLQILKMLARQARAYELALGPDLIEIPELIHRLIPC